MLSYADAEAFFASQGRHAQSNAKRLLSEGFNAPPYSSAATAKLIGGVLVSSGIYQIKNQINGNRYIGSAVNLRRRWQSHLAILRHEHHTNVHLQRAYNKYGEGVFDFTVLEHIEDALQLIPREQHFLDTLKPEYNISPTAGNILGYRHTEKARRKISQAQKGERGNMYGKQTSEEIRRKISESLTGRQFTDEHREHLSEAMKGKHRSEETKHKISEARKAWWQRERGMK